MRPRLRILADLWARAKSEPSTPREISWSIAIGVFCGCTPFLGFHMWIALALATLFRLNRLWAFVGSRISFTPFFAVITFCEIELGHRLRTRAWAPLSPRDAVAHGRELLGDWLLGTGIVGSALASLCGLAAYFGARRWQSAAARRLTPSPGPPGPTPRTRSAPRPLPSESPPSTPAAPPR